MTTPLTPAAEVAEHPAFVQAAPGSVSIVRWLRPVEFQTSVATTVADVLEQARHFLDGFDRDLECLFEGSDGRTYRGCLRFMLVPAGPEEVAELIEDQEEEEAG